MLASTSRCHGNSEDAEELRSATARLQTRAAVRADTRLAARWALKAFKVHPETLQAAVRSGQRGGSRLSRAGSGLTLALFIPHLHSVRLSCPPLPSPYPPPRHPLLMPLKSQMDGGSLPLLLGYGARAEDTWGKGRGGRVVHSGAHPPPRSSPNMDFLIIHFSLFLMWSFCPSLSA